MNHLREIEKRRTQSIFSFMPPQIIRQYNQDPHLIIKVPQVKYPTTEYLDKFIKQQKEKEMLKNKIIVQQLQDSKLNQKLQRKGTVYKQNSPSLNSSLHSKFTKQNSRVLGKAASSPVHDIPTAISKPTTFPDDDSFGALTKRISQTQVKRGQNMISKLVSNVLIASKMTNKEVGKKYLSKQLFGQYTRKKKEYKGCDDPVAAIFPSGCLTCGKQNIQVKYFKQRHVCLKCRDYLKNPQGKPALVFHLPNGTIIAVSKKVDANDPSKIIYQQIDHTDLRLFDQQAMATFADQDQMIVILKHPQ